MLLALAALLPAAGCGPSQPTAFRIYVYYDQLELDIRQISIQVGFFGGTPGLPAVRPMQPAGPLDQGASVGVVFDAADSGKAAVVVLTALGSGGQTVATKTLDLVTPAVGEVEDQFVGFGTSPPIPPPGQVNP
jgi:hypothetical protein